MRGLFVVFEGVDRCGKSTQVSRLIDTLRARHLPVHAERFPDRTTRIGALLDAYLSSSSSPPSSSSSSSSSGDVEKEKEVVEVDSSSLGDRAVHLLFSANRWEKRARLLELLDAGTHVVCDRYAFSGVAFSSAKGLPLSWC
eukprot:EC685767.1.p3 GENE.EC685767.1~~EC685767.1.p3  ORF type:complete len:141 (+),score=67.01 EC685767.1:79-501(+)